MGPGDQRVRWVIEIVPLATCEPERVTLRVYEARLSVTFQAAEVTRVVRRQATMLPRLSVTVRA